MDEDTQKKEPRRSPLEGGCIIWNVDLEQIIKCQSISIKYNYEMVDFVQLDFDEWINK